MLTVIFLSGLSLKNNHPAIALKNIVPPVITGYKTDASIFLAPLRLKTLDNPLTNADDKITKKIFIVVFELPLIEDLPFLPLNFNIKYIKRDKKNFAIADNIIMPYVEIACSFIWCIFEKILFIPFKMNTKKHNKRILKFIFFKLKLEMIIEQTISTRPNILNIEIFSFK